MADEPLTIRGINWRETFPFTNLFRAFRVAIHPSKLVLALVALLLMYLGGNVLDALWAVSDRAVPGEVVAYQEFQRESHPGQNFSDQRARVRQTVEAAYAAELLKYRIVSDPAAAQQAARNDQYLGRLKDAILKMRDTAVVSAQRDRNAALAATDKLTGSARADARTAANTQYEKEVYGAYESANAEYQEAKQIKNEGLFEHFFEYESTQVSNVVLGVRQWNWLGEEAYSGAGVGVVKTLAVESSPLAEASMRPGVVPAVFRFFTVGPVWLLTQHTLYFFLFGMWFLVLWAIFGGAISRIAAVHVARDEKMSIRSALKFSVSKFLSFLFAPIIPLLIVVVVGIIVSIASLVGNIPFLGPIIIGALFFLALAAGFIMALVLLGLIGGFNLMYPTVAVEGSDSFDAISRSFSYLYARPWRLAFYTLVAVVYGALTYLFVRLFIYLMLVLSHKFVGAGIFLHAPSTAPLWPTMWPSPASASRLSYGINFLSLNAGDSIGAFLVSLWVYLVIAILGAFVISFYFSANTIIYYLMRREVDATEMDDVYLEQIDDEFAEPTPATPAVVTDNGEAVKPAEVVVTGEASDVPPPT